ncbi:starch-binding protein [Arachidicoccus ginsenosidimutans]|uniref:RagB/SusD family nutrient uptake outer membrane protein n=1 Tax=Arachidicoccus sp. BS20 TaxID=1850526 RepID=UPI0007F0E1D1|nr:RagB/SusD family nutrient uptake outer membrane protein [Arachidicoccus sp. BS20]ANI89599.1 starch-binding protein [Arachidicoccus sp. BS20]
MIQIKTNRSIVVLSLAILLFGACTKELNQAPVSNADKTAIFGSQDGLQLYANSFYNILPGISDVYKTDPSLSDYGAVQSVPNFIVPGAYTSVQSSGWDWGDLRNINYFIAGLATSPVPDAVKENYMALAKFFRAYFYYAKVQRFGDVPWYSTPLSISDTALLYKGRDSRVLIMDSIVADLDYAAQHIASNNDNTRSTISKGVIFGFKSRVCLFEGTFRKYQTSYNLQSTANDYLKMAVDAADSVIESKVYSLNTVGDSLAYRNLFISATPVTSEIMLADVSSTSLAVYNDANWYYTSATYGPRFSFIKTFINTYLNRDGTPFTDKPGYDTITFVNETKNRDWRLQQTIRTPGYKRVNSNGTTSPAPPVFSNTYTGYQPIKWCLDGTTYDNGATNTNSISLMRYAEILLNYAEAKAELGTITDQDWAMTIGALRARAGITGGLTSLPTTVDKYLQTHYFPDITNPVILEIRRERGIELALEGLRFADLIRWKRGDLLLNTWDGMYVPKTGVRMDLNGDGVNDVLFYTQSSDTVGVRDVTLINVSKDPQKLDKGTYGNLNWLDNIQREWADYKYVYPIPFSDLQLNPKLGQNPDWK